MPKGIYTHTSLPMPERFWKYVNKSNPESCWNWTGSLTPKGYGQIRNQGGGVTRSHRAAWIVTYGDIPNRLHVLHKCDNRKCCNPEHLFLGTNRDNMDDKVFKGRQLRGSKSPVAILIEPQVRVIKRLFNFDLNCAQIASFFGVARRTIGAVKLGENWKHIEV